MSEDQAKIRSFALLALGVILTEKIAFFIFVRTPLGRSPYYIIALDIHSIIFAWILPLLIVYLVERRNRQALGLFVEKRDRIKYLAYATIGIVVPALILGIDKRLLIDLFEQLIAIGVAEEVLWRGYLQSRLSAWLGKYRGWLVTALLFGFAHLVSLWSRPGLGPHPNDLSLLAQTTAGGLILGYIFLRAKNIVPGSIFHVFGNVYLFKLVDLVSQLF
jgi:membrane protease YdiL (CAAX protease family)